MGGISNALASAAREYGVEILTNHPVSSLILDDYKNVKGVKTQNGKEFRAPVVLSNATPEITFLTLCPEGSLPPAFVEKMKNLDYTSSIPRFLDRLFTYNSRCDKD